MKIAKLRISNYLRISDIEMNPSHTNVIVGKNKQGKTSVLKAIRAAFTGDADSSSIRIGESKAEITVELEELTVRRSITAKGSYLDITNKDGFKVPAPQKYLDGILGSFSFNPVEFFDMKASDRKKYLLRAIDIRVTKESLEGMVGMSLTGLDFDRHALEVVADAHKSFYDRRTLANAEVSRKQKAVAELAAKIPDGFDPSLFDEARVNDLRAKITSNETRKAHQAALKREETDLINRCETLRKQYAAEMAKLTSVKETLKGLEISDTTALESELADIEKMRSLAFEARQVDGLRKELSEAMTEREKLDAVVQKLAKEIPQALVSTAKLPVEGISITDDDVLVNGVSLDNMSTSEQLRFGLDIVRHLNDTFKVICIDGVECLDKETFEWFLREIENDDYQYFCTRVDADAAGKNQIVIEDGAIREA